MTGAITGLRFSRHEALHVVPLGQLFALSACHAWGQGMEPGNGGYEDRELEREIGRIKARDAAAASQGDQPEAQPAE